MLRVSVTSPRRVRTERIGSILNFRGRLRLLFPAQLALPTSQYTSAHRPILSTDATALVVRRGTPQTRTCRRRLRLRLTRRITTKPVGGGGAGSSKEPRMPIDAGGPPISEIEAVLL